MFLEARVQCICISMFVMSGRNRYLHYSNLPLNCYHCQERVSVRPAARLCRTTMIISSPSWATECLRFPRQRFNSA